MAMSGPTTLQEDLISINHAHHQQRGFDDFWMTRNNDSISKVLDCLL